jgi:hypothetical protein
MMIIQIQQRQRAFLKPLVGLYRSVQLIKHRNTTKKHYIVFLFFPVSKGTDEEKRRVLYYSCFSLRQRQKTANNNSNNDDHANTSSEGRFGDGSLFTKTRGGHREDAPLRSWTSRGIRLFALSCRESSLSAHKSHKKNPSSAQD